MNTQSLSEDSEEVSPQKGKQPPAERTGLSEAARKRYQETRRKKYASDPEYRQRCREYNEAISEEARKRYLATQKQKYADDPGRAQRQRDRQNARYANDSEFAARARERAKQARESKDPSRRARSKATAAAWKLANLEKVREIKRKSAAKLSADPVRRERRKTYLRNYLRNRRNSDMAFQVLTRLRNRINALIKKGKGKKSRRTLDLVGCDAATLKEHIAAQFTEGMSWDRISEIHIDHTIPCRAFNMLDEEQQKTCFNYKNLRPLWAVDNLRKLSEDLKVKPQLT